MNKLSIDEKLALLDETVEFYSKNPRSVENGACVYLTSEGYKCAFSRIITDDQLKEILNKKLNEGTSCTNLDIVAITGMPIQDERFYQHLQSVHDTSWFWLTRTEKHIGTGLTPEGIKEITILKEKIRGGNI